MRSSVGGTWLLSLMIVFILLFSAFIILTINYSKTIKVKNEMLAIVEKYEGLNQTSITLLNNFLDASGYNAKGYCKNDGESGIYGSENMKSSQLVPAQDNVKYYYCVKKFKGTKMTTYYQVSVFYRFNLPIIGDTSGFRVRGTTNAFHSADESAYSQYVG